MPSLEVALAAGDRPRGQGEFTPAIGAIPAAGGGELTEYADSAAHANREETCQAIFESPEFVAVEPARPSAEMRTFAAADVRLRQFVSSGER